jgi:hypothetical protein
MTKNQSKEPPMEQQIYDALTIAAELVCDAKCPAVWKTAEKQPHSDECKKIKAARSAWIDHCSYMDLVASGGIEPRTAAGSLD